nr:hypothetical protein [Endozoicomonas sp.]
DSISVVPKQPVRLDIKLGSDRWFTAPPHMPLWDMPGAVVVDSKEQSGNFIERREGKTISGVNRYYHVVPRKTGRLRMAPQTITLFPAQTDQSYTVKSQPLWLDVQLPGGINDLERFLPASELTLSESFNTPQRHLDDEDRGWEVGDAIIRTITIEAQGVMGRFIPSVHIKNNGMNAYAAPAKTEDILEPRGRFLGGKRTEVWTYRLTDSGRIELPAVEIEWWDTTNKTLKTAILESISLTVAPSRYQGDEQVLDDRWLSDLKGNGSKLFLFSVLLVSLIVYGVSRRERFLHKVNEIQIQGKHHYQWFRNTEIILFFGLLISLLTGSGSSITRYHRWKSRLPQQQVVNIDIREWSVYCFSNDQSGAISKAGMIKRLIVFRFRMMIRNIKRRHIRVLPDLNGL